MAPRHAARLRRASERAVRLGEPLQADEANEGVLNVVEECGRRASGRPDAGTNRPEGPTRGRQPGRIRPEGQERRSARAEKEPHRKVPEEGYPLGTTTRKESVHTRETNVEIFEGRYRLKGTLCIRRASRYGSSGARAIWRSAAPAAVSGATPARRPGCRPRARRARRRRRFTPTVTRPLSSRWVDGIYPFLSFFSLIGSLSFSLDFVFLEHPLTCINKHVIKV